MSSAATFYDNNGEVRLQGQLAGGPILAATATLTDAQVKALPTTSGSAPFGIEILAAPPSGSVIVLVSGLIVKYGAAYTNVDAAAFLTIAHSGFNDADNSPEIICGGGTLLDTALDETAVIPLTGWTINAPATPATLQPQGGPSPLSALDGLGLILFASNANSGDFTGGGAGNRLVLHLLYTVFAI